MHETDNGSPARSIASILLDRVPSAVKPMGDYVSNLTLRACCDWHLVEPKGGWLEPVKQLRRLEGHAADSIPRTFAYQDQFFRATADSRGCAAFVADTREQLQTVILDENGLAALDPPPAAEGQAYASLFSRAPRGPKLYIDYMHDLALRLASAAAMGGDPEWFDLAVHQFIGHAQAIRNADGLWHLGRGWSQSIMTCSPGAWSRGHGWLLRGMAETLRWLPADHPRRSELEKLLVETLVTLAPLQDEQGMWHVLLHLPFADSEPETSGTGLIAYAIARAIAQGSLSPDPWTDVARRAISAVCARVSPEGIVSGACSTPGLLLEHSEALYFRKPIAPGDHHGLPSALYACLGDRLLEESGH